jgi:hypothetical protein
LAQIRVPDMRSSVSSPSHNKIYESPTRDQFKVRYRLQKDLPRGSSISLRSSTSLSKLSNRMLQKAEPSNEGSLHRAVRYPHHSQRLLLGSFARASPITAHS